MPQGTNKGLYYKQNRVSSKETEQMYSAPYTGIRNYLTCLYQNAIHEYSYTGPTGIHKNFD